MEMVSVALAAIVLATVHLVTAKLRFLEGKPRNQFLSAAGGVSVGFVFVHLLPEIAAAQEIIDFEFVGERLMQYDVWLLALFGLLLFYGLDRLVRSHHAMGDNAHQDSNAEHHGAFWIHLGCFAIYNVITGMLIVDRLEDDSMGLWLFVVAMALHFVSTDFGLHKDYRKAWLSIGRWALMVALILGIGLGYALSASEFWLASLTAFLGGAIVLNVMREELPEDRQSRFPAFAMGAVGYAVLLVFL